MTDVALKEHLESKIAAVQAEVSKSERILNERLAGMNEFRDALKDQAAEMATRKEMDLRVGPLEERVRRVEAHTHVAATRWRDASIVVAFLIQAIAVVVAALAVYFKS